MTADISTISVPYPLPIALHIIPWQYFCDTDLPVYFLPEYKIHRKTRYFCG